MKGFIIVAAVTAVLSTAAAPVPQQSIAGQARIADGGTLQIGNERIRLFGIDAPGIGQSCNDDQGAPYSCGLTSLGALQRHIGNDPVTCEPVGRDEHGDTLARCYTHGEDLNRWMVTNGWAIAHRQLTEDYVQAEDQAHSRHAGMWRGAFALPSQLRTAKR